MTSLTYEHRQSAHCESGVTSNLLRAVGCDVSEAMAFGIGSGIFFVHIPFVKVMGLPLTSFRTWPGSISKKAFSRLGIGLVNERFRQEASGVETLDTLLEKGVPVGAQVSVMWLDYLPKQFRFPFNAHHLTVLSKHGDQYTISDPIAESVVTCPADMFLRARFAKGPLAPKGKIFYAKSSSGQCDVRKAAIEGLRETSRRMLYTPLPFFGLWAIKYLAKQIKIWPHKIPDKRKLYLNLGQIIRMQEEIGTGGAGFRFLYASFLQEAAGVCDMPHLQEASQLISKSGDVWRNFAVESARICRDRSDKNFGDLSEMIMECYRSEKSAFQLIAKHT